jgi:hypothetical protein
MVISGEQAPAAGMSRRLATIGHLPQFSEELRDGLGRLRFDLVNTSQAPNRIRTGTTDGHTAGTLAGSLF